MTGYVLKYVLLGILSQGILVSAKIPDWVTDDMIAMAADDKARCMGIHGTTEALIDEVNDGILTDNPAITCYIHCLFESFSMSSEPKVAVGDAAVNRVVKLVAGMREIGMPGYRKLSYFSIDDDGELDTDMLLGILPEKIQEMGRDLVEECAKQTGTDGCNKIFNIGKCVLNKRPEVWFLL